MEKRHEALLKEGYLRRYYCTATTGGLHEYISIDDEFSDKNNRSKYACHLLLCKCSGSPPEYKDIEEWLDFRYACYLKTLMRYRELNKEGC